MGGEFVPDGGLLMVYEKAGRTTTVTRCFSSKIRSSGIVGRDFITISEKIIIWHYCLFLLRHCKSTFCR